MTRRWLLTFVSFIVLSCGLETEGKARLVQDHINHLPVSLLSQGNSFMPAGERITKLMPMIFSKGIGEFGPSKKIEPPSSSYRSLQRLHPLSLSEEIIGNDVALHLESWWLSEPALCYVSHDREGKILREGVAKKKYYALMSNFIGRSVAGIALGKDELQFLGGIDFVQFSWSNHQIGPQLTTRSVIRASYETPSRILQAQGGEKQKPFAALNSPYLSILSVLASIPFIFIAGRLIEAGWSVLGFITAAYAFGGFLLRIDLWSLAVRIL